MRNSSYYEQTDITAYFSQNATLAVPAGFAPNQAVEASLNVPTGTLPQGIHWLHIAVRDPQGRIHTDSMAIVVGTSESLWQGPATGLTYAASWKIPPTS
ncbi:hypothetical protein [Desulfosoma sp.]